MLQARAQLTKKKLSKEKTRIKLKEAPFRIILGCAQMVLFSSSKQKERAEENLFFEATPLLLLGGLQLPQPPNNHLKV